LAGKIPRSPPRNIPGGSGKYLDNCQGKPPFWRGFQAAPCPAPVGLPAPDPPPLAVSFWGFGRPSGQFPGHGGGVPLCPASPLPVDPLPIKERLPRAPRGLDQEGRRQLPRQSMRIPAPRPVAAMACPVMDPPACRPALPAASPSIGSRRGLASIASPGRSAAGIRGGSPGEGKGGGLACLPALGHRRRGRSLPGWIPGSIQGLGQRLPWFLPVWLWRLPPGRIHSPGCRAFQRPPLGIPSRWPSATPGASCFCRGSADKGKGSLGAAHGRYGACSPFHGNPSPFAPDTGGGACFLAGFSDRGKRFLGSWGGCLFFGASSWIRSRGPVFGRDRG